jgi:hypothetical protein
METNGRDLDGKFIPGHGGFKKKGVPEFQRLTRQKLGEFLQSKLDDLPEIYAKLSARDKAKLLITLSEFFLPKQREIILDAEGVGATIDYTKLSQATLSEILKHTTIRNENGAEN